MGLRHGIKISMEAILACHPAMVQDSITDDIDAARENSSHLKFTYRIAIILFLFFASIYFTRMAR